MVSDSLGDDLDEHCSDGSIVEITDRRPCVEQLTVFPQIYPRMVRSPGASYGAVQVHARHRNSKKPKQLDSWE